MGKTDRGRFSVVYILNHLGYDADEYITYSAIKLLAMERGLLSVSFLMFLRYGRVMKYVTARLART